MAVIVVIVIMATVVVLAVVIAVLLVLLPLKDAILILQMMNCIMNPLQICTIILKQTNMRKTCNSKNTDIVVGFYR